MTTPASAAQPACVVNCASYDRDGRRHDISLARISDVLGVDDGTWVWVGLYEPGESLLDTLQEEFGLHDLAVEDAHHAHQRPKLEAYGHSLFLALRTAQRVDGRLRFGETQVFVGQRFLVTVRHGASLSYAPLRQRLERDPQALADGPMAALHAVLDFIVDNYEEIAEELRLELEALEQAVFDESSSRRTVRSLFRVRKELVQMRMAVAPMQDILGQVLRSPVVPVPAAAAPYFGDVLDHARRVGDTIDVLREIASAAMNVTLSLVTISQGEIVKRLAGWAALLAAPTLVASWYGMNFEFMPEFGGRYAYPILIGVVVVVCVSLYRYLKRVGWL